MDFKSILFGLLGFILFTSMILTFAIQLGNQYGRDSLEIGGGSFNVSEYEKEASTVGDEAENYRDRFSKGGVEDVDKPSGVFSIITDISDLITTPFKLLGQISENILGIPKIVTNISLGIIGLAMILGIWKIIRTGY